MIKLKKKRKSKKTKGSQSKSLKLNVLEDHDFKVFFRELTPFMFWPLVLSTVVVFLNFFITNGILNSETTLQALLKKDRLLVNVQTDVRKRNIFYSTVENYLKLQKMMPFMSTLVTGSAKIRVPVFQGKTQGHVQREVSVILVDHNFFSHVRGEVLGGREINEDDISFQKNVALMTPGLSEVIYGESNKFGRQIFVDNEEYKVVGLWKFQGENIIDNEALILPITNIKHIGQEEKTYITNFIIRDGLYSFRRLKKAIDTMQLNAGFSPLRPDYEVVKMEAQGKNRLIWQTRKSSLDLISWVFFLLSFVISLFQTNSHLSKSRQMLHWRRVSKKSSFQITNQLFNFFLEKFITWFLLGIGLSLLLVVVGNYVFHVPIGFGLHIHPSLFLVLLYPLTHWMIFYNKVLKVMQS
jgi:hypothetical protein